MAGLAVLLWWWRRGRGAERAPVELGAEKGRVEGDAGVVYRYQAPPQEMWGDERVAHEMGVEGVRGVEGSDEGPRRGLKGMRWQRAGLVEFEIAGWELWVVDI